MKDTRIPDGHGRKKNNEREDKGNRSTRYFNDLLKLSCLTEVVQFFRNISSKEVTESFGGFQAVADTLGWKRLRDRDVVCLVPGDGTQPRTGVLFAYRSNWKIWSIDPQMRPPPADADPVRNLHTVTGKIEDFEAIDCRGKLGVIVAVHGHFFLDDAVSKLKNAGEIVVVSMPCCYDHYVTTPEGTRRPPDRTYSDPAVWSNENELLVWHWKNPRTALT
mmetsp:Transcript_39034/g.117331  ORF Transcript_39034/g.117331 Transcript_39034/m.117331 type:complete len:219 (-) Transcript_39034:448-1104(-)|eukprot:CAMPEP_0113553056 /NCGR_PEP_ID=MMETSP0015_2-20120614/15403_1 /TAXON_ID=2838 /ORGANISM="Odontella" /LENGTH=218 /DNA_ID=CAMNT_0000454087 /DNA_START=130 /DNA_END=786 /DNA_ORIENTATION=- /assembly_acc=CAM_ASM_000160